jgi:carbon-monoxide dehydrogenase large subunit
MPEFSPPASAPPRLIGAPIPRVEDGRLLSGRGRYVADHARPRMLHVAFARSPHPHALIRRIDTTTAHAVPGVIACVTGEELARDVRPLVAESRMKDYKATRWPALAVERTRFAGEAVAAVLAADRYGAEDGVDALAVDWAPLPAIGDARQAMAEGAGLVHEEAGTNVLLTRTFAQGDVDAAFADAPVVVGDRFRFHRHAPVALENRACLAEFEPGSGRLTVWSSTQVPGMLRDALAELLAMPAHLIHVIAPDVGGGFGLKSAIYPEEIALAALARRLGQPVKWVGDRREDLLASTQSWDEEIEAELALDRDGRIRGLRARVVCDVGAYSIYPWTASIEAIQVISFLPGPYRVPHYRGQAFGVATHKAPLGPYRGVGRPVSTFVTETLVDRAARRLGLDPAEIRRRNFIRPEELPYRSPSGVVWDSGSFAESLETACARIGYEGLRTEQARGARGARPRARGERRWLGIGIASYVELTGIGSAIPASPGADISTGVEGATLRIDQSGTVTASFGLASHGQGHETTLAQVVADELGVKLADVRVVHGDTAQGPVGSGTYASRSAVLGGGAAILAARALREKTLTIAAHLLEAAPADLEIAEGAISVKGSPERQITLRAVARAAYAGLKRLPKGMEPGLEATRFYDPYFGTASSATHIAVVAVDPDTAVVSVLRYAVVEDGGRIINPLIAEGQVTGGVAQGVGAALLEEVVYDGDGQLLTGSLMDYLVPTAVEVPSIDVLHLDRPSPSTLGGFKGIGEGGTIGAPAAIANAVADALAPLGAEVRELPITPERLFRLLTAVRARGGEPA